LGQPGSGANIFKIELPTNGQIYRFNKTIIEGEPIQLTFYYSSNTLITIIKILLLLLLIWILFMIRKKVYTFFKGIYHWVISRKLVWEFLKTTTGLRTTLFVFGLLFMFISQVVFVVLVLLFILSIFRPNWLLPHLAKPKKGNDDQKEGDKGIQLKDSGDQDEN
jgi:glucan phosphoethanolaminetransferase (alkaline phosphatase superfamily)